MTHIQVIPTDPMLANHPDGSDKVFSVGDVVFDAWDTNIDENDDYFATLTTQGPAGINIPVTHNGETILPDTTMSDRVNGAASYLEDTEPDLMDAADAVLIVDYWGDGQHIGLAQDIGTAGDSSNFTGLVDTQPEDAGDLPPEASTFGSEGIGFHEVLHLYDGIHSDASTLPRSFITWFSAIWSPASDNLGCNDPGTGNLQNDLTSVCTTNTVQDYLDANDLV